MFVVDLMHEVELGMWKHLFIHLLRIIDAEESRLLNLLDYRLVLPTMFYKEQII